MSDIGETSRVQFFRVDLKFLGHTPPICCVEVVVSASLDGSVLVVVRMARYAHNPNLLFDVIPPISIITKRAT